MTLEDPKTNWTKWYLAVTLFLILQIVIYYLITNTYK